MRRRFLIFEVWEKTLLSLITVSRTATLLVPQDIFEGYERAASSSIRLSNEESLSSDSMLNSLSLFHRWYPSIE